jgi:mRNA interferase RelE/StbE
MPRYAVYALPRAERDLKKLPRHVRLRVEEAIDGLAADPRPSGVKKLKGREATYRIRVGRYRILYEVHDDVLEVLVVEAGHRRDVYD